MDLFITMHAYLRFVILALGILGVLRSLVSLGTATAAFARVDEVLSRGYSGALDLQTLIGVVLVLGLLGSPESVPAAAAIAIGPTAIGTRRTLRFTPAVSP